MTEPRSFIAKTIDIRDDNGIKTIHIRTKDDLRFVFKCGEHQVGLIANEIDMESGEKAS